MAAKKLYSIPVLYPKDRDMKKRDWYVFFRFLDVTTGDRIPFKLREDINQTKNKAERIKRANAVIEVYHDKLKTGWNPITNRVQRPDDCKTLLELLQENLDNKKNLADKSKSSYKDILNNFKTWLTSKGFQNMLPYYFTPVLAQQYSNYLIAEKNYKGKTHNTKIEIIRSWFKDLIKIGVINENAFLGIDKKREEKGKYFAFNADEQTKLKEYLFTNNKRLFYACQFLFYLLIRPKELIRMRVEDINFENKTVVIHSENSKNNNQQSVTIPRGLEKIMYEMGLDMAPKHFYVFGNKFNTCERKMITINGISGAHRKATKALKIDDKKSFYSWKHTGACALYNATKDVYLVKSQCRHSSVSITEIYLRSLGLVVNQQIREAEYSF